jgi:peptide/nickel transport system permease protein
MSRRQTVPAVQTAAGGRSQDVLDNLAEERRARQGNRIWRRLKRERKALVGIFIVGFLVFLAIFAPTIAPYDPDADDFGLFVEPSLDHPFGTDSFGRDLFSRVLIGTRVSLTIGILAALSSMIVGVTLGLLSGYYGGWIDSLIMRFIDLVWAFPVIILTVGMVAIFGTGARNVVIAIALAYLDDFARVVRAEVLRLREEEFMIAARAIGAADMRIMARHMLPNIVAPIIVQATFAVGLGILAESGLTFLGLGVDPSTPTWGLALNEGRDFVRRAWWISVFPGLAIVFTVLALNLFGDGLRDAFDVRGVGDHDAESG